MFSKCLLLHWKVRWLLQWLLYNAALVNMFITYNFTASDFRAWFLITASLHSCYVILIKSLSKKWLLTKNQSLLQWSSIILLSLLQGWSKIQGERIRKYFEKH